MSKKIDTLKTYMSTRPDEVERVEKLIHDHFASIPLSIKNRNHFNWWLAISYMEKNPSARVFARKLEELAANWVTCACGNQCYIIPRATNGAPKDKHLYEAGKSFYQAVSKLDWEWARICLEQIEKYSAQVIKEELEKM